VIKIIQYIINTSYLNVISLRLWTNTFEYVPHKELNSRPGRCRDYACEATWRIPECQNYTTATNLALSATVWLHVCWLSIKYGEKCWVYIAKQ